MKTSTILARLVPAACSSPRCLFRTFSVLVSAGILSTSLLAQPATPPDENGRTRRRTQNGDANGADNGGKGGRGNFDPAEMQAQMMTRMREQFAITDDAEWGLISERINKVSELRRGTAGGGGFGGRGGPGGPGGGGPGGGGPGGGGGTRGGRGGATGNPEVDSLRSAITDKLPDAEIKSRLSRLREVRKENEMKLSKAQEDLRAVLSVRQEAVAVMFGLLP